MRRMGGAESLFSSLSRFPPSIDAPEGSRNSLCIKSRVAATMTTTTTIDNELFRGLLFCVSTLEPFERAELLIILFIYLFYFFFYLDLFNCFIFTFVHSFIAFYQFFARTSILFYSLVLFSFILAFCLFLFDDEDTVLAREGE